MARHPDQDQRALKKITGEERERKMILYFSVPCTPLDTQMNNRTKALEWPQCLLTRTNSRLMRNSKMPPCPYRPARFLMTNPTFPHSPFSMPMIPQFTAGADPGSGPLLNSGCLGHPRSVRQDTQPQTQSKKERKKKKKLPSHSNHVRRKN